MSQTKHPLISGDRQFQLLARAIPDCAFYLLDSDGVLVSRNAGAERLRGYSAAEVIGRHFSLFYDEHDRKAGVPQQNLAIAVERGRFATEAWQVSKDGSRLWASITIEGLKAGDKLLGFAKITRDITAEKLADERHERDEAQYRAIVDTLVGGVAVIDEQGIVESFNPAAERIFGYEAAEMIGRNIDLLMPEPDRSQHDCYIANYRRTGQPKIIGIGREVLGRARMAPCFRWLCRSPNGGPTIGGISPVSCVTLQSEKPPRGPRSWRGRRSLSRKRWRRWGGSPAASHMTSTIFCR